MANDRLMKMYLFNEDTFRKVKERLAEEKNYNHLDRAMKNVLGQKMSSNEKWLLYRQELQKFLNLRRRMMGYDVHHQTEPPKKTNSKKNFFLPTRKIKTYNIATDTRNLPAVISTKKHKLVQVEPDKRSRVTQTGIPIRFNQTTQVQPETRNMETDTMDLPPAEDYLSLSMLNEENSTESPAQGRLSAAATASLLMNNDPDVTIYHEDSPTQIMEIYGNKYQISLDEKNDFEDYSAEFHKTHHEGDEIDMDDFYDWLAKRREHQETLVHSPAPSTLRLLHGPYRERSTASTSKIKKKLRVLFEI